MTEHKNILALRQLRPMAGFAWKNPDSYVTLKYRSDDVAPTESEILEQAKTSEFVEAMGFLRSTRNAMLSQTDWRDLPSYAGTKQAEWRVYRQALRDITSGLDTVEKVNAATFPTQPS
tara:strand:+ start:281 stop:634 length:354 start_codon:yes stop_codon:yes gene_type:complete